MRVFGLEQRDEEMIEKNEIKINEMFGIDDFTSPNNEFPDPYITCCFVGDDKIFVQFFHNHSLTHYHFIWDYYEKRVIGVPQYDEYGCRLPDKPIKHIIDDTYATNFPNKSFYSAKNNEIYCFYR